MSDAKNNQVVISDEDFQKLPEEGTFGQPVAQEQTQKSSLNDSPLLKSLGISFKNPNGPPEGWTQAVINEATKPVDPETKWMAGVAATAIPLEKANMIKMGLARLLSRGAAPAAEEGAATEAAATAKPTYDPFTKQPYSPATAAEAATTAARPPVDIYNPTTQPFSKSAMDAVSSAAKAAPAQTKSLSQSLSANQALGNAVGSILKQAPGAVKKVIPYAAGAFGLGQLGSIARRLVGGGE